MFTKRVDGSTDVRLEYRFLQNEASIPRRFRGVSVEYCLISFGIAVGVPEESRLEYRFLQNVE